MTILKCGIKQQPRGTKHKYREQIGGFQMQGLGGGWGDRDGEDM